MDEKFNVEDSFHCAQCFQSWCADSPSCPTRYAGHLCRRSICLSMENCVLHLAHDMAPQIHEFPMVSFYNQVLFVILGLSLRRSPCLFERKWWVLCILVFPFLCQVHGTFGSSAAASLFFSCFITDRQSVTGWFVNIAANHLRWKVREFDFFDDEATHVLILHEHRSSGGWNFLVA